MIRSYRKKPVVVEAVKIVPGVEAKGWFGQAVLEGKVSTSWVLAAGDEPGETVKKLVFFVDTLEGTMRGNEGDYLIRGVRGELYPCAGTIFEETYEAVRDNLRTAPARQGAGRGDKADESRGEAGDE